jgi:hypothetical protein
MKKIAILLLLMTLWDPSFAQSQPITNALAKNDRRDHSAVATEAFLPDWPTGIQQNSIWSAIGTTELWTTSQEGLILVKKLLRQIVVMERLN